MPANHPSRRMTASPVRANSYVLIVDTDSDRIARAVRECADILPARLVVTRDGDDAVRMLTQFGAPVLLVAALSLPGKDGFAVIDAVRRLDDTVAIVAFADDREVREYAACRLSQARARVLGAGVPPVVLKRCLETVLHRAADPERDDPIGPGDGDRVEDSDWSGLAARAREALGVAGAAVYAKSGGHGQYRLSVIWTSESPMPPIPDDLPATLQDVIEGGAARIWPDLADEAQVGGGGAMRLDSLRSLAIVPVRRNGEIVGALSVFDLRPHAIRESDLDTLIAIVRGGSTSLVRRRIKPSPVDRDVARQAIAQEVARVRREQLSLSVILLAASRPHQAEALATTAPVAVTDMLARGVRGSDLIVRWTDSEILLVLVGVGASLARRIAERIRTIVETTESERVSVSGAVSELRTTESFEGMVARAEAKLRAVEGDAPQIA